MADVDQRDPARARLQRRVVVDVPRHESLRAREAGRVEEAPPVAAEHRDLADLGRGVARDQPHSGSAEGDLQARGQVREPLGGRELSDPSDPAGLRLGLQRQDVGRALEARLQGAGQRARLASREARVDRLAPALDRGPLLGAELGDLEVGSFGRADHDQRGPLAARLAQEASLDQPDRLGEGVVEAPGGHVHGGVRDVDRDLVLEEELKDPDLEVVGAQVLERAEDHRVVADDQARAPLARLLSDLEGQVEGREDRPDTPVAAPDLQASPIALEREARRADRAQRAQDSLEGNSEGLLCHGCTRSLRVNGHSDRPRGPRAR